MPTNSSRNRKKTVDLDGDYIMSENEDEIVEEDENVEKDSPVKSPPRKKPRNNRSKKTNESIQPKLTFAKATLVETPINSTQTSTTTSSAPVAEVQTINTSPTITSPTNTSPTTGKKSEKKKNEPKEKISAAEAAQRLEKGMRLFFESANDKNQPNLFFCLIEGEHKSKEVVAGGSTSHMHAHFKNNHTKLYQKIKQLLDANTLTPARAAELIEEKNKEIKKGQELMDTFARRRNKSSDRVQREISWCLLGIVNNWSFNSMCSEETQNYFETYHDTIPPNRALLSGSLLQALYEICRKKVIDAVKDQDYVAVTTDGATDFTLSHWFAVTGHWINKETFKLHKATFGILEVYGRHTGEMIASHVEKQVKDFAPKAELAAIVPDNAADVNLGASIVLQDDSKIVNCYIHTQSLAQKDILTTTYESEIENLRDIVIIVRRRTHISEAIKEMSNSKHLNLPRDVRTRFDSTYTMLVGFYKNHIAIKEFYDNNPQEFEDVAFPDMQVIEALIEVYFPSISSFLSRKIKPF